MEISKNLTIIGAAERIQLAELGASNVPARIDTGARTSALWVSAVKLEKEGLSFALFAPGYEQYTGKRYVYKDYAERFVTNSTGKIERRYTIQTKVSLQGRTIRATFTLANRQTQVYPILIGRNILRGKFIVNVMLGSPLREKEQLSQQQKAERYKAQRIRKIQL